MTLRFLCLAVVASVAAACAAPLDQPERFSTTDNAGGASGTTGIARGKIIYTMNGCSSCHKDDLSGGGPAAASAANITPDATRGIGTWSTAEIKTVIRTGVKKDGSHVCALMTTYTSISEADLTALVAYIQSVAPSTNAPPACK